MLTELSTIRIPCEEGDENFISMPTGQMYDDGTSTTDEAVIILVNGAAAGVTVGKVYVDIQGEFCPLNTS
jgi:hypothetical protein